MNVTVSHLNLHQIMLFQRQWHYTVPWGHGRPQKSIEGMIHFKVYTVLTMMKSLHPHSYSHPTAFIHCSEGGPLCYHQLLYRQGREPETQQLQVPINLHPTSGVAHHPTAHIMPLCLNQHDLVKVKFSQSWLYCFHQILLLLAHSASTSTPGPWDTPVNTPPFLCSIHLGFNVIFHHKDDLMTGDLEGEGQSHLSNGSC